MEDLLEEWYFLGMPQSDKEFPKILNKDIRRNRALKKLEKKRNKKHLEAQNDHHEESYKNI